LTFKHAYIPTKRERRRIREENECNQQWGGMENGGLNQHLHLLPSEIFSTFLSSIVFLTSLRIIIAIGAALARQRRDGIDTTPIIKKYTLSFECISIS
jgi:hypothetical protein